MTKKWKFFVQTRIACFAAIFLNGAQKQLSTQFQKAVFTIYKYRNLYKYTNIQIYKFAQIFLNGAQNEPSTQFQKAAAVNEGVSNC